jgi:hypothetical protein
MVGHVLSLNEKVVPVELITPCSWAETTNLSAIKVTLVVDDKKVAEHSTPDKLVNDVAE